MFGVRLYPHPDIQGIERPAERRAGKRGALITRRGVSGGYGGGVTPLPIPNREVKPSSADGTARETVWESRSPPGVNRRPLAKAGGLLFSLSSDARYFSKSIRFDDTYEPARIR